MVLTSSVQGYFPLIIFFKDTVGMLLLLESMGSVVRGSDDNEPGMDQMQRRHQATAEDSSKVGDLK